jgi:uncharacterized protein YajQ (UPF0234 family)
VRDVLLARLAKRGVDVRFLDLSGKPQKMGGDKLKQPVPVKSGIDAEPAKKIQADQGQQAQGAGAIQGDAVRVTGAKRDDLQAAMRCCAARCRPAAELQQLPRLTRSITAARR